MRPDRVESWFVCESSLKFIHATASVSAVQLCTLLYHVLHVQSFTANYNYVTIIQFIIIVQFFQEPSK